MRLAAGIRILTQAIDMACYFMRFRWRAAAAPGRLPAPAPT